MHIIQYGVLWTESGSITNSNNSVELHFHHVTSTHPAAFCHAVNQSLVKI